MGEFYISSPHNSLLWLSPTRRLDCCVEDRLDLVNTLADGNYFRSQHPHGQLCLTAAAWAGSGQVIKLLVSYGGLLTIRNLAGNTLLHSIILQSSHYPGKHLHLH